MNALTQNTKITASDINTLISELNGKLNLSGGTLNGVLRITSPRAIEGSRDNKYLVIAADEIDAYKNCSIFLHNIKSQDNAGCFQLRASDGTNTQLLHGSPTGTLSWGGNEIPTSKTGVAWKAEHDSLGNVISDMYFKKIVKYYGADATVDVNTFTDATSLLSQSHITGLSSPGDSFFYIIQLWYSSTSSSKVQIAIGYQTGNMFRRTYYAYTNTWTTWKKCFEDNNSRLTFSNGTSFWIA